MGKDATIVTRSTACGTFRRAEHGQDLVEYGLLVALIVLVALGAVSAFGQAIYSVFWETIANNF